MTSRDDDDARDRVDPLAALRDQFVLPPGVIYLDGNSLGPLPRATLARVQHVVREEWGEGLIRSWNSAGWIDGPRRVGDAIGRLVGAQPGEVLVADSTSVNLHKLLATALRLTTASRAGTDRSVIVSERGNFPTDLYIAETLAAQSGFRLELLDGDARRPAVLERLAGDRGRDVAVVMLTQVDYRSGARHDMAEVTAAAHRAGALVLWDLAHSAGAFPVDLHGADADFAVGCGYKYLNGGPGAPAFLWVHPRHLASMQAHAIRQPLSGWIGHAEPFAFSPGYQPAEGIAQFLCGTPAVLSLAALECGVATLLAADPFGGLTALREKSLALTSRFIELVEARCAGHGLQLVTPREPARRGSQVSFSHPEGGYAIVQALIERGVIGDFRAPDVLRFGFTPLYLRHVDVWDAVEQLRQVLESGQWREPRFHRKAKVT
ncbi:MAG: kynureninase [Ideonella sp.]|jgi:kynureninase|nr:kynureninase [Ideonella sp.]